MMAKIAETTEAHVDYKVMVKKNKKRRKRDVSGAVGFATVSTAMSMDAVAIIIPTMTGETARLVSHFRPEVPIYAISPLETTVRKMQLYWGVYPLKGNEETSTVNMIENPCAWYAKGSWYARDSLWCSPREIRRPTMCVARP